MGLLQSVKKCTRHISVLSMVFDGGFSNAGVGPSNAVEGGKYEDRARCLLGHNAFNQF
jgi:hypothetical protein